MCFSYHRAEILTVFDAATSSDPRTARTHQIRYAATAESKKHGRVTIREMRALAEGSVKR